MDNKKMRISVIVAVALFVALFAAMLACATIYDLEISKILTKDALPAGQYFSTSQFGLFFEAVGSCPIYLVTSLGCVIAFWLAARWDKKGLNVIIPCGAAVGSFATMFLFVRDIFEYIGEHMHTDYMEKFYVLLCIIILSAMLTGLLILAWKNVSADTNRKLRSWLFVILTVLACYLIVNFVKSPMGRMRFRAMNYNNNGFDQFTRWYVKNGKRNLVPTPHGVSVSDSCKSFPSGHTYSAAMVYTLTCLPYLLPSWNKKWVKALLWVLTIGFTAAVAISRIVVGAHFMSDVLFGGTISFLAMIAAREIFVCKGCHIKCFFNGKKE